MYLIFSEKEDRQTNEIIDRLLHYDKDVRRYNRDFTPAEKNEILEVVNGQGLQAGTETKAPANLAIYHRRPSDRIIGQLLDRTLSEEDITYPKFEAGSTYFRYFKANYLMHQVKYFEAALNDPSYTICKIDYPLNKYEVLLKAQSVGMNIPPTLISGDKEEVTAFFKAQGENIITKTLYEIIPSTAGAQEGFHIKCYTQKIEDLSLLPDRFFPTLFQKNIEKKYELRIFYLDGACFAAAILSQLDADSQQDFRNADRNTPNRVVPYNLSAALEHQIVALMQSVGLNTGSLDIMIGVDGKPYFLEINPVGQYGWINTYCNFGISDALAQKMIQYHG